MYSDDQKNTQVKIPKLDKGQSVKQEIKVLAQKETPVKKETSVQKETPVKKETSDDSATIIRNKNTIEELLRQHKEEIQQMTTEHERKLKQHKEEMQKMTTEHERKLKSINDTLYTDLKKIFQNYNPSNQSTKKRHVINL